MEIVLDKESLGKIVIEVIYYFLTSFFNKSSVIFSLILLKLFKNIVPKTCENFRLLCTGEKGRSEKTGTKLHYENCLINRIVPNGWLQGGG